MTDLKTCQICGNKFRPFLDLGFQPIANGFIKSDEIGQEKFYPTEVGFCDRCYTVQLFSPTAPKDLFNDKYAFHSSTSKYMEKHFEELAREILEEIELNQLANHPYLRIS